MKNPCKSSARKKKKLLNCVTRLYGAQCQVELRSVVTPLIRSDRHTYTHTEKSNPTTHSATAMSFIEYAYIHFIEFYKDQINNSLHEQCALRQRPTHARASDAFNEKKKKNISNEREKKGSIDRPAVYIKGLGNVRRENTILSVAAHL